MRPLNEFATAELAILARSLPQLSYRTYDHATSLKRKGKEKKEKEYPKVPCSIAYNHLPEQGTILIPLRNGKGGKREG